jgi:chorismate mutase
MLDNLRNKIDKIDKKLTDLLTKRYGLVKKIACLKHKNNIPIEDKKREKSSIKSLISSQDLTLSERKYIKNILSSIHNESKNIQK